MKKLLASGSLVLMLSSVSAQQDYQYTHYMFDRLSFNPGYAGIDGKFCATAMFREQWAGFGNQPRSILFNFHAPVELLHGGAGLTIFSDKLGFQSNTVARGSYSFHQYINNVGTFGFGISAGIISVGYKPNWIAIDPVAQDNAIPDGNTNQVTYDVGLGIYLKGNSYYAGISTTHLTQSELKNVNFTNRRHYQIVGGYDWSIPNSPQFQLNPSVLIKSDGTSTIADINVRLSWLQAWGTLWAGAGYRIKDAIMPMIGGQKTFPNPKGGDFGTLRIGYAYDVTTSAIKNYSSGSHDIFVNYCFDINKPKPREVYRDVRSL